MGRQDENILAYSPEKRSQIVSPPALHNPKQQPMITRRAIKSAIL